MGAGVSNRTRQMAVAGLRATLPALCCLLLCAGPISAQPSACASLAALVDAPGPLFVASFPASPPRELLRVAFLYDNAAAALALIGCGEKNKAAQIGDAILAA